jgi:hypothetical protein
MFVDWEELSPEEEQELDRLVQHLPIADVNAAELEATYPAKIIDGPTGCEENLDMGVGVTNQKVLLKSLRRRMGEHQTRGEGDS